MNILFTGVSSFTGAWFAAKLAAAGHHVTATTRQQRGAYTDVRRVRLNYAAEAGVDFLECCAFGDRGFMDALTGTDVVCHHAAEVTNYKSLDFDVADAVRSNTRNVRQVIEQASQASVRGLIVTGTVSEQDEGLGDAPLRAFSPYALSKGISWQIFSFWAGMSKMPIGKFVIPNPFGPLEDERYCAYLVRTWAEGAVARVQTPDYVRDNIPVDRLAERYVEFVEAFARQENNARAAPSGYVESQGRFTERFARELGQRLNLAAKFELTNQTHFAEPIIRINAEPALAGWDEAGFWDNCAEYYRRTYLS
jgi:nucleoside-diphosphate-sugar epimerase